jgi:hypothetical protein
VVNSERVAVAIGRLNHPRGYRGEVRPATAVLRSTVRMNIYFQFDRNPLQTTGNALAVAVQGQTMKNLMV